MPAEHRIDTGNKIIVTTWSGEAGDSDLIDSLTRYQQEIRSRADYHSYDEILDFSQANGFSLTTDGIRKLAQLSVANEVAGVRTRLAIVVASALAYGLGRMYATYRSLVPGGSKDVRVFREFDDARAWLEVRG